MPTQEGEGTGHLPASQKKIITKLLERRQIEAELRGLLAATSEQTLRRGAQEIAARGRQVIPVVIGNLDRADARMLAALGVVSALLDREEMTTALRQVILQPQYTDQGRLGAMTILERFLGQPRDDELQAALSDPQGVAISSLEEVLDQAEQNPASLIEYVQGLDQQEPDVVLAVVRALRDRGRKGIPRSERAIEPLRMMAQDVREEISSEALRALGAIRLPGAAQALQTLIPTSAPGLRPAAERLLRKLQFSGVRVTPLAPPPPAWRALVGTVDGRGQRHVWFIERDEQRAQARFLSILMSDQVGAVEAVGHTQVPLLMLPPQRPLGEVHDVALPDGSGAVLMLEASFDLGRRLLLEALEHNRETQIPVAGPLRFLSPWLWSYSGADSLPPRIVPEEPWLSAESGAKAGGLLEHPAFAAWLAGRTLPQGMIHRAAQEAFLHPNWDLEVWVGRLGSELFAAPAVAEMFSKRLEAMAEWLLLAGDDAAAQLALAAALSLVEGKPQEQPLLLALVRRDLELALLSLEQKPSTELNDRKLT
jgi:hypothetical protein